MHKLGPTDSIIAIFLNEKIIDRCVAQPPLN